MKLPDYIVKYLIISFIIFNSCIDVTTIAQSNATMTIPKDSVLYMNIIKDDWNIREEKSLQFIHILNAYYNDSSKYTWRIVPDSTLCLEIIKYYSHKNPLDGYPGEIQSITIYDFFYKNDSLFKAIDYYMNEMDINPMLQDSIWIRISYDIWGNIEMNELWDEEEQKKNFMYLLKKGFFVNDYDSYIK